jgi:hypothetical protein
MPGRIPAEIEIDRLEVETRIARRLRSRRTGVDGRADTSLPAAGPGENRRLQLR